MAAFRILTLDGKPGEAPFTIGAPGLLLTYQTEKEAVWAMLHLARSLKGSKINLCDATEAECTMRYL